MGVRGLRHVPAFTQQARAEFWALQLALRLQRCTGILPILDLSRIVSVLLESDQNSTETLRRAHLGIQDGVVHVVPDRGEEGYFRNKELRKTRMWLLRVCLLLCGLAFSQLSYSQVCRA